MTELPRVPREIRQNLLRRQVGFLAKSDGTPLWLHSFGVWAITARLASRIPRFDDRDRLHLELAALLHDDNKATPRNQAILAGQAEGAVCHPLARADVDQALAQCPGATALQLGEVDLDRIWEFAHHHSLPDAELKKLSTPGVGLYCSVLRWADWLASMVGRDEIDRELVGRIRQTTQGILDWTIFSVGRPASPTTSFCLQQAVDRYRGLGWTPLAITEQAVLFVASPGTALPTKADFVRVLGDRLRQQSIAGQNIQFRYIRYEVLAGEAKADPAGFLAASEDFFLQNLGDVGNGPVLFFRTLMDLLKLGRKLAAWRKSLPAIDLLAKLGGTNSVTAGKAAWRAMSGESDDLEINEILRRLYATRHLADLVPEATARPLREMPPKELFAVLTGLAGGSSPPPAGSGLAGVLACLVGMEEETDFVALAKEALARYSDYKQTHRPKDGLCEQCATPVPLEAKPTLNIPEGRTGGFTQVNARVASDSPKVICPLCVFDAAATRQAVSGKQAIIFARLASPLPEVWTLYPDLEPWVRRLDQALQNIREVRALESFPELHDLPLPARFPLPVLSGRVNPLDLATQKSPRGLLIPLAKIKKGEGIKELRARYLALYALLNALGFKAHIGREEQTGLFGETPDPGLAPDWVDRYRGGLAVSILAYGLKRSGTKTSSAATFARNLLESAPGVALSLLGDAEEGQKKRLLDDSLLEALIDNLMAARLVIATGKEIRFTMKELLQDALFFATHSHFFPRPVQGQRTRHAVCKPVDAVMNALLQGQAFEEAFSRLIAQLRETVRNEAKPDGVAKYDQDDLVAFLKRAKDILGRYAGLRRENIAAFIRTKNALRAALFMVSRYPKIKEVIDHA